MPQNICRHSYLVDKFIRSIVEVKEIVILRDLEAVHDFGVGVDDCRVRIGVHVALSRDTRRAVFYKQHTIFISTVASTSECNGTKRLPRSALGFVPII